MGSIQILLSFNLQFRGRGRLTGMRKNIVRISCCSSYSNVSGDPYKILGIRPWDSVTQVKKAFRKLAKQYHPDVCKGKNCGVQFEEINAAYEAVMSDLRGESSSAYGRYGYYEESRNNEEGMKNDDPFSGFHTNDDDDDHMKGRTDLHWDYRDEWIGWEVGNWIFYHQDQQQDHQSLDHEELDNKSCYSQLADTSSSDIQENNVSD